MKNITIQGIDDELEKLIRDRADCDGTNFNETIKKLLREAVGFIQKDEDDNVKDFLDLFGVWTESDFLEFENAVRDFDKISSEDWR